MNKMNIPNEAESILPEKISLSLKCVLTEHEHFAQHAIGLPCGHFACKKCIQNVDRTVSTCFICGENGENRKFLELFKNNDDTNSQLINFEENLLAKIIYDLNEKHFYKVLLDNYNRTLNDLKSKR